MRQCGIREKNHDLEISVSYKKDKPLLKLTV